MRCTNKTGISGIHIEGRTGKYITRLYIDNKRIYVGKFNTLDEAKEALERRKNLPCNYELLPAQVEFLQLGTHNSDIDVALYQGGY